VDFGLASTAAATDLQAQQLRWCDYWLKGVENGVMDDAPVRIFVMGANEWRGEHAWPLARTKWSTYFLHSSGHANSAAGDGLLTQNGSRREPPDTFDYDPGRPVETHSAHSAAHRYSPALEPSINEVSNREQTCSCTPRIL
jgi:putative CocE/NonD family hydrolase